MSVQYGNGKITNKQRSNNAAAGCSKTFRKVLNLFNYYARCSRLTYTQTQEEREFMDSNQEIFESEERVLREWKGGVRKSDRENEVSSTTNVILLLFSFRRSCLRGILTSFSLINLSHRRSILFSEQSQYVCVAAFVLRYCYRIENARMSRISTHFSTFEIFLPTCRWAVHESCTWILQALRHNI